MGKKERNGTTEAKNLGTKKKESQIALIVKFSDKVVTKRWNTS